MAEINERGAKVQRFFVGGDRYHFDFEVCTAATGWAQYDTEQDASYFGVWVHRGRREIVTFCEGDLTRVICPTQAVFEAELAAMAEYYGPPPPAWIVLGDNTRTDVYDESARFGREIPEVPDAAR